MLRILALRERTKQQLEAKFNLRDFHDTVLKNGAMLPETLEQVVGDYVAAKKAT
jgi:uncharacterized protein (DUF885 family)